MQAVVKKTVNPLKESDPITKPRLINLLENGITIPISKRRPLLLDGW